MVLLSRGVLFLFYIAAHIYHLHGGEDSLLLRLFVSELNFIPHIKNMTKTGFQSFSCQDRGVVHAFITHCLDYCNALLSSLPKKSISNLQLLQNSAAKVLMRTRRQAHYTHFKIAALAPGSILRFYPKFSKCVHATAFLNG